MITERDILLSVGAGQDPDKELVAEHLTSHLTFASPEWSLEQAAAAMVRGGFRHLVVVERGELAGILSMRDIVRVWIGDGASCEVPAGRQRLASAARAASPGRQGRGPVRSVMGRARAGAAPLRGHCGKSSTMGDPDAPAMDAIVTAWRCQGIQHTLAPGCESCDAVHAGDPRRGPPIRAPPDAARPQRAADADAPRAGRRLAAPTGGLAALVLLGQLVRCRDACRGPSARASAQEERSGRRSRCTS